MLLALQARHLVGAAAALLGGGGGAWVRGPVGGPGLLGCKRSAFSANTATPGITCSGGWPRSSRGGLRWVALAASSRWSLRNILLPSCCACCARSALQSHHHEGTEYSSDEASDEESEDEFESDEEGGGSEDDFTDSDASSVEGWH